METGVELSRSRDGFPVQLSEDVPLGEQAAEIPLLPFIQHEIHGIAAIGKVRDELVEPPVAVSGRSEC